MGRFKIKKQDTFIDMTPMSDVMVLLLTFFMLTSTFVKKEPIKVNTPGSVSEIKVPETSVLTILVESTGKIFMQMDNEYNLRDVLPMMAEKYSLPEFTQKEIKTFGSASAFGVPMSKMKSYLDMSPEEQDAYIKSKQNEGIPCDSVNNEFKDWVSCAREVNPDLKIAIKADAKTSYKVIKKVMNSLQDIKENRYNLITSLKKQSED